MNVAAPAHQSTPPAAAPRNRNLAAIGWMLLTTLGFVGMNGMVRALGDALPAAEAAFIRFACGLVFLIVPLRRVLARGFAAPVWRLFILRGALHTVGVILWFYAMARITVAEVTAIGFLNPIVVAIGAALFLGERLGWRRILAIALALGGALIVLRPGLRDLGPGHIAQVGAALAFGASYIVVKKLTALVPATAAVAMMSLTVCIGLAPIAAAVWVPPTLAQVGALAATAVCGTAAFYAQARAYAAAPITVTQPVVFLQLLWASLLGVLAFDERLDPWVLVGGAIMVGAVSWIALREARLARRTRGA